MSEIENDGVVPEEAAYGVGSLMPGDEHVADGRVGARTVGAEVDVVVVIIGLPPAAAAHAYTPAVAAIPWY